MDGGCGIVGLKVSREEIRPGGVVEEGGSGGDRILEEGIFLLVLFRKQAVRNMSFRSLKDSAT